MCPATGRRGTGTMTSMTIASALAVILCLTVSSCGPTPAGREAVASEIAATLEAEHSMQAPAPPTTTPTGRGSPTRLPSRTQPPTATPTTPPSPSPTPSPTPTKAPTATPSHTPTATPSPAPSDTATPAPRPTASPLPASCKPDAEVVASEGHEVYAPLGFVGGKEAPMLPPGEPFAWLWRVRSTGCARWPEGTVWAYVSGHRMEGPEHARVRSVRVGETYEIVVEFVTPPEPGAHQGFWQMQGPDGTRFGEQGTVQVSVYGVVP